VRKAAEAGFGRPPWFGYGRPGVAVQILDVFDVLREELARFTAKSVGGTNARFWAIF